MIDRMVGCLSLNKLKLTSATTLTPGFCFAFILKAQELKGWEHGNTLVIIIITNTLLWTLHMLLK